MLKNFFLFEMLKNYKNSEQNKNFEKKRKF